MNLIRCLTLLAYLAALLFSGLSSYSQNYQQMVSVQNSSGTTLTSQADIVAKYATLLNVPKDSIKNISLYTLIEQYSGTPYKYGGTDVKGVDCSGFSCAIEKQVYGLTIPRTVSLQAAGAKPKTIANLKEGDLVFLKSHTLGVYLMNGYFAEVTSNAGLVLNNLNDPDMQQRIASCGSFK